MEKPPNICSVSGREIGYPEPICYVGHARITGLAECVAGLKLLKLSLPKNRFVQVADTFDLYLSESQLDTIEDGFDL